MSHTHSLYLGQFCFIQSQRSRLMSRYCRRAQFYFGCIDKYGIAFVGGRHGYYKLIQINDEHRTF